MISSSTYSAIWKFVVLFITFIPIASAADGCYLKNGNDGIQVALAQYPCSSNGGVQVCCNIGDTCGEDSICRKNTAVTLPAALTSTSTVMRTRTATAVTTTTPATVVATHLSTTSVVVALTSTTLARVTSQPVASITPITTPGSIYTISSISLPVLASLRVSLPSDLNFGGNLIPRQSASGEGFYVGGCTDSSYDSTECSNHCTGYSTQNIVYNNSAGSWSCCGDTEDCSAPTSETFDAIPPSSFDTVSSVSPAAASTLASSVLTSASAAGNATSAPPHPSGLSPGATAGIVFGVTIPLMFVLAAAVGFCLRKRKIRAIHKAHIDRVLGEELAGTMRSIDSWYGGPTLRADTLTPPVLGVFPNDSGGVDAPGHTFAYETSEGLREVKLKTQAAVARRMPLQLQLPKLHLNLNRMRGDRTALVRAQSGTIVSPQDMASSPVIRRGGQGLVMVPEYVVAEEMECTTARTEPETNTWPFAPPPTTTQRPWEFQRSVVSLREMDGTGVNPLEQRQSVCSSSDSDADYEDIVVNSDSSPGSGWQVHRPWHIQKPPSLRGLDGTGKLQLPAW